MTTLTQAQSVSFVRLQDIFARQDQIANEIEEFFAKIAVLQAEDTDLRMESKQIVMGAKTSRRLMFDDDEKTLHWDGGRIVLQPLRYRIVYALYRMKKKRLSIESVIQKAWGDIGFPSTSAIRVAISELKKALRIAKCPYQLKTYYRPKMTLEIQDPNTGKLKTKQIKKMLAGLELIKKRELR
jgi:hypothetical protein